LAPLVVPPEKYSSLPPEAVVESTCVEEFRWRDATLDVAVLDRKTTPFLLNVTSHAVRSVSPLADWDAPIAAPGLPVPSTHNHVVLADGFPPCVHIFLSALRGNVYCPNSPPRRASITGDGVTAPTGSTAPEALCAVAMERSTRARLPPAESPLSAILRIPRSTSPR
jgi:hypothetical protein